jgi:hypothetical protein
MDRVIEKSFSSDKVGGIILMCPYCSLVHDLYEEMVMPRF